MKIFLAARSHRMSFAIGIWAVDALLLLFVSIAGFMCFHALWRFLASTFRLETTGENTRLALRPPSGFWKITDWCAINAANIALAVIALLYLRESVLLLILS